MGDLRSRGRDEVAEGLRHDVPVRRRQRAERGIEMRSHDPVGAAEPLERLQTEDPRPTPPLLVPEPSEDELKIGRLDAHSVLASSGGIAEADLAGGHLLEHRLDQRRLDLHLLAGVGDHPVPALERLEDRPPRGVPVEVLEP